MMFGKNCQKELLFRFLQQRTFVVFEDDARKKEKRVVVVVLFLFSLSLSLSFDDDANN